MAIIIIDLKENIKLQACSNFFFQVGRVGGFFGGGSGGGGVSFFNLVWFG